MNYGLPPPPSPQTNKEGDGGECDAKIQNFYPDVQIPEATSTETVVEEYCKNTSVLTSFERKVNIKNGGHLSDQNRLLFSPGPRE